MSTSPKLCSIQRFGKLNEFRHHHTRARDLSKRDHKHLPEAGHKCAEPSCIQREGGLHPSCDSWLLSAVSYEARSWGQAFFLRVTSHNHSVPRRSFTDGDFSRDKPELWWVLSADIWTRERAWGRGSRHYQKQHETLHGQIYLINKHRCEIHKFRSFEIPIEAGQEYWNSLIWSWGAETNISVVQKRSSCPQKHAFYLST